MSVQAVFDEEVLVRVKDLGVTPPGYTGVRDYECTYVDI